MEIIDWRINYECMEKCKYCFACKMIPVMTRDMENTIIEKICKSHIRDVNITGGEPMLKTSRCIRIINSLYSSGKRIYLSTNGYAFQSWRHDIYKLSLLGLPLDGYDEVSNCIGGRSSEAFSTVTGILSSPEINSVKVKIGTVVTKQNLTREHLGRISKLLDNFPINIWRIYEVLPENRGEENKNALLLSNSERLELESIVQEIKAVNHSYRIELVTRRFRSGSYFIIQPNGVVMIPVDLGDRVDEYELGSLVKHDFSTLEKQWSQLSAEKGYSDYIKDRINDIEGDDTL